eukprot:g22360.t1
MVNSVEGRRWKMYGDLKTHEFVLSIRGGIIHQPVHIPVEVPVPLGEEEVVKVPKIVQKTRKKQVEVEQVVDVPVHQVQEELLVTPVLIQKERLVHRPVQQIIEIPAPQLVEEEVPVPCVVEQEDVNFRMVEQIVPVHRPQIVEKLVEVPKVQLEEKIIQEGERVPMIQRNWVDTVKKQHVQVVETERPKTLQKLVKRRKPILQEKIVQAGRTPNRNSPALPNASKLQVPKIVQEAVPVKKVLQREVEVPTVQWEERFVGRAQKGPAPLGQRLEKLSKQVLGSFTDESHVRRSLEGRRYVTPFLLEQLIHSAGEENVFTSELELEKHSLDHSHHLASAPEVVIYARSTEMISEVMKVCWRYRIPVTPCGARTVRTGTKRIITVSLDMSKMNQVLHVYREELQVHVQAGVRKEALNEHLEPMGLFFQVDPASNPSLGGMSATGASGTLCCNYGTMKENVVSLTVVLADGTIVRPTRRRTRKNSTGYDLTHLCMGQELKKKGDCSRSVVEMRQAGIPLARCELLNRISIESLNAAVPTLFLQVHAASSAAAESALTEAEAICAGFGAKSTVLAVGKEEQERLWDLRRSAYYACRANRHHMLQRKAQDIRMLSTDVCVPLSHFCLLIEETEKDYAATAPERFLCNIFGHAADGNFHCVVLYDHADPKDLELLHQLDQRMWARCLALGGTVSGEHGCGMGKEEWGQEAIDLMWRLKRSMDEREILNPGKLLPSRS